MKTLLFLSVIFLSGCGCVMPQIPPQFIYAGADCSAPIPDYTEIYKVDDNCMLSNYSQDPFPGTLLDPVNMSRIVTLIVTDMSANVRQRSFSVTLVDTVKPIFIDNTSLLSAWERVDLLYDLADKTLKELVFKDQILNVEADYLPQQVGGFYADGLTRKRYPEWYSATSYGETTWHLDGAFQVDSSFLEKTLVIRVPPNQKRLFIFE